MYDFIFRFDVNDNVGVGHFQRVFALVEKIVEKKYRIACVGCIDSLFQESLAAYGIRTFKVGQGLNCRCLIIDHYGLIDELLYSELTFSKLVLFEDMDLRAHSLPVLVINALGNKPDLHKRFPNSEVLAGLEYFLFRKGIERLKCMQSKKYAIRKEKKSIMISLGGTDQRPMLKRICSILINAMDPTIDVVVLSPFNISLPKRFEVIIGYDSEFINKAINFDLVICGAGQTFLELIYLNQNPIGIVLAGNQSRCAKLMSSYDAMTVLPDEDLEEKLVFYLNLLDFQSNTILKSRLNQSSDKMTILGEMMSSKSNDLVDTMVSCLV